MALQAKRGMFRLLSKAAGECTDKYIEMLQIKTCQPRDSD